MPDRKPEYMSDRMPEYMSDRMPEYMPDRMPECMSDIISVPTNTRQNICEIHFKACVR